MQNLRQTDFMFHANSKNGLWGPKKEEEESSANDLKWLHIRQVKQTDVFIFFGTTETNIKAISMEFRWRLFQLDVLGRKNYFRFLNVWSFLMRWRYWGINGEVCHFSVLEMQKYWPKINFYIMNLSLTHESWLIYWSSSVDMTSCHRLLLAFKVWIYTRSRPAL